MKLGNVKSREGLAAFLNISLKKLTYILYVKKVDSFYDCFNIEKATGGERLIEAPNGILKSVQKTIANKLYIERNPEKRKIASHGFEKGKSIISNAQMHIGKRYILNMDIKDFFPSIHFGRVKGYFEKNNKYNMPSDIAGMLANLLCYNGRLPQGAPTSPIVANMIADILDYRLIKIAKKYKLYYTRYADDLTFSTNDKNFFSKKYVFVNKVEKVVEISGFSINKNKTRLTNNNDSQQVTGLVVNNRVAVNYDYYKKIRAMANSYYKTGVFIIDGEIGTVEQLQGRLSFINQIEKHNNKKYATKKSLYNLNIREKEMQKFLFYENFLNNDKTVLLTEGKTDIVYLKAALMKYSEEYPSLVKKKENGKFEFKISFMNKTNNNSFFLIGSSHGGNAIGTVSDFYYQKSPFITKNGKKYSFFDYFSEYYNKQPKMPVILFFDNEQEKKDKSDKPLRSFLRKGKIKDKIGNGKLDISTQLKGNLFVMTHPKKGETDNCEIEDLFDEVLLDIILDGKSFSRDENYNQKTHFGKHDFSMYVLNNYINIDFKNFKRILDELEEIVENWSNTHKSIKTTLYIEET